MTRDAYAQRARPRAAGEGGSARPRLKEALKAALLPGYQINFIIYAVIYASPCCSGWASTRPSRCCRRTRRPEQPPGEAGIRRRQ